MLKKAATFLTVLGATFALGAGAAAAHTKVFDTDIGFRASAGSSQGWQAMGVLDSPKRACLGGRDVLGLVGPPGEREVRDFDVTSANGAWRLSTDVPFGRPDLIRVTKKRIGPSSHRHSCGADTYVP